MKARVIIADDHSSMIQRICRLLSREFVVAAQVADGLSLIETAQRLCPEVIVTDISMPGMDGLAAVRKIKQTVAARAAVVVLTMHEEKSYVDKAFEVGVLGYVLKTHAEQDLIPAIQEALQGRRFLTTPRAAGPQA